MRLARTSPSLQGGQLIQQPGRCSPPPPRWGLLVPPHVFVRDFSPPPSPGRGCSRTASVRARLLLDLHFTQMALFWLSAHQWPPLTLLQVSPLLAHMRTHRRARTHPR